MHYSVADAHPCSEVENAPSELSQLMPTLTDTLDEDGSDQQLTPPPPHTNKSRPSLQHATPLYPQTSFSVQSHILKHLARKHITAMH